jgi:glycogen debranching enzyme
VISRTKRGRAAKRRGRQLSPVRGARTVLRVGSNFYVLASSLASRRTTRVLADGRSFAIFDATGDIVQSPFEALGFFHRDTRYLSRFELQVAGQSPYFLNSFLSDDKAQLRINLTNPDFSNRAGIIELPRNSVQIERSWALDHSALVHRLLIRNFTREPIKLDCDFLFDVDFADLFEVRGVARKRHGQMRRPEISARAIIYRYRGLDGADRQTELRFSQTPRKLNVRRAHFPLRLAAEGESEIEVRIIGHSTAEAFPSERNHPATDGAQPHSAAIAARRATARGKAAGFHGTLDARRAEIAALQSGWTRLSAGNELIDDFLRRSQADLTSIVSHGAAGTFIMAGIPWFATLFGRDSIVTALSVLPFNPGLAAGTLRTLARFQGAEINQERDEQPGKIVHEMRAGEMAHTGEIPFGRYYGSVDSTPLFLWLYGRYVAVTGDLALADELWPNVERALEWIVRYGDLDGDGYVEYARKTPEGLVNQGWKDSFDSIFHADGALARPPIALAEVQGYVYAAYRSVAQVASRLNHNSVASRLAAEANALKANFNRDFWLDRERTVALALDADKKPCRVMASNAAHCLACGLLERDQAAALAERLLADDMFSGWGIRTLSAAAVRYNPMSYHNGSVWPHDNAIAALGLARIPGRAGALKVFNGMLDAAVHLNAGSLPELFCGFPREPRLGPVPYPVACHPQAWAAASVLMILQAMLGLDVNGFERRLEIESPAIPTTMDWLLLDGLAVGGGKASVLVRSTTTGASAEVTEKSGAVTVEVKA